MGHLSLLSRKKTFANRVFTVILQYLPAPKSIDIIAPNFIYELAKVLENKFLNILRDIYTYEYLDR